MRHRVLWVMDSVSYLLIRQRAEGEWKGGEALVDLVEERTGRFHLYVVRTCQ
jgi:hypothetical protein